MTLCFLTDENNDLYIDITGNIALGSGIDAVQQICLNAAKAQLGEMVLSTDQGIPNFQAIWVGTPNVAQFEVALRRTLNAVEDVTEILSLNILIENKILTYVAVILTIYGEIKINDSISIGG